MQRRIAFCVDRWSADATLFSWTFAKQFFLRVRLSPYEAPLLHFVLRKNLDARLYWSYMQHQIRIEVRNWIESDKYWKPESIANCISVSVLISHGLSPSHGWGHTAATSTLKLRHQVKLHNQTQSQIHTMHMHTHSSIDNAVPVGFPERNLYLKSSPKSKP